MQIKNIDTVEHLWGGIIIQPNTTYTSASVEEDKKFGNDSSFITDLSAGKAQVIDNGIIITDIATALGLLRKEINYVYVKETPPFAEPLYRTKRDKTSQWTVCPANQSTVLDFQLTADRYVTGGKIIYKNSKEGDYITAEIHDTNGVIPAPYRAALCEAWPTVAQYINNWVEPTELDKYGSEKIDTYPLNAKISAGLFLRVTYHSSAVEGDRKVAVNYNLTKKL